MKLHWKKTASQWTLSSVLLLFFSANFSTSKVFFEVGNLIKKESITETWRYKWTQGGMLKKVIRPDKKHVDFTYDALGRRLTKTFKEQTTHFVWDGNVPLHEWTSSTEESNSTINEKGETEHRTPENLTTWIFEDGTFIPMAKLQGYKSYSIITDHLGTPVESYDEDGKKVWSRELNIYGETRKEFGEKNFIPFLYQGQYFDIETELVYNRYRFYDPSIGLFISQDPIGLHGNMPNFYSYVEDSNSWVDPVGLMPWGFMNGASATITAGSNSGTFSSSSAGHAEINGLNSMANAGHLSGQDVVISDVIGHFPEGTKDVGVCTNCRSNIFDPLQRGGANSVTFPVTKGNQVVGSVKIESKDFAKVQAGIDRIRKGSGALRQKSDAAWDLLQKNSVCH